MRLKATTFFVMMDCDECWFEITREKKEGREARSFFLFFFSLFAFALFFFFFLFVNCFQGNDFSFLFSYFVDRKKHKNEKETQQRASRMSRATISQRDLLILF